MSEVSKVSEVSEVSGIDQLILATEARRDNLENIVDEYTQLLYSANNEIKLLKHKKCVELVIKNRDKLDSLDEYFAKFDKLDLTTETKQKDKEVHDKLKNILSTCWDNGKICTAFLEGQYGDVEDLYNSCKSEVYIDISNENAATNQKATKYTRMIINKYSPRPPRSDSKPPRNICKCCHEVCERKLCTHPNPN